MATTEKVEQVYCRYATFILGSSGFVLFFIISGLF